MERREDNKRILDVLMSVERGIMDSRTVLEGKNLSAPSPSPRLVRSPSPRPIMTQHRAKKVVDLAVRIISSLPFSSLIL